MTMGGGIFSVVFAAAVTVHLTSANHIEVSGERLRLADVAEIRGADAASARMLEIARVRSTATPQTISRSQLIQLIRQAVPGADIRGKTAGAVAIRSIADALPPQPGVYEAEAPTVTRGQRVRLSSVVGPVTIERTVTALQNAGSSAMRLFVRSDDGEVFSAPLGTGTMR